MPYFGTPDNAIDPYESVLYAVPFGPPLWRYPCTYGSRLEFLPGTAITTAVRVVKDECDETELGKTRMFARRRALVVMEINGVGLQAERISLRPHHYDLQEKLPSLPISSLELLFLPFPVYIT